MNIIEKVFKVFFKNIFISKDENEYIQLNQKRWSDYKTNKINKRVILIDLFPWSPWIHIWSYLANIISKRENAQIKFFYFHLIKGKSRKFKFFFRKLFKIYRSFNAEKGIFELDFIYSQKEKVEFNKNFIKVKNKKENLISYKKDGIKIGDLIYDTCIRTTFKPTVELDSSNTKETFFRAEKIFNEIKKYFKKYNVRAVVPSHTCYISYGIILRYALKKNIPVYKIFSLDRGSADFKLIKINKNFPLEENPYNKYNKIFNKIEISKRKNHLFTGKKIIKKRTSGQKDKTLPYIKRNLYASIKNKIQIKKNSTKKIFLFPHCYLDWPHRYRSMLFPDFYEQSKYILNFSNKGYELYYKEHPNEFDPRDQMNKHFKKLFPKIKTLPRNFSHKTIINSKPYLVVTNHGTICHEYAYFKIPVINTGDNPHINYNFSLNPKSINELKDMIINLDKYKKKINFDKNNIHEFIYMHYEHFKDKNKNIFRDKYFSKGNVKSHVTKKQNFKIFLNQKNQIHKNIFNYIENFFDKN